MNLKEFIKDRYKDGISAEDLLKLLEETEMPADNSSEIEKLKNALSKSNSEAASYKKQLNEKLSDDEKKAKEDAEKREKLQNDYNELLRKVSISENKARLLSLGYADDLAGETAEALTDGNVEKILEGHKKYLDAAKTQMRADILKETPRPDGGNSDEKITPEKFSEMSYGERAALYTDHPEEYKMLSEKGGTE